MIPMMPVRLTASPIRTMTSRPLTLDIILRLMRLITKPRKVTKSPSKTIIVFSLFLVVLPGLALQKEHDRASQHQGTETDQKIVNIRGQAGRDKRKRDDERNQSLRLCWIRTHLAPPE